MDQVRAKERQCLMKELELRTGLNKQLDVREVAKKQVANLVLND
jgi:hypothetical protein